MRPQPHYHNPYPPAKLSDRSLQRLLEDIEAAEPELELEPEAQDLWDYLAGEEQSHD